MTVVTTSTICIPSTATAASTSTSTATTTAFTNAIHTTGRTSKANDASTNQGTGTTVVTNEQLSSSSSLQLQLQPQPQPQPQTIVIGMEIETETETIPTTSTSTKTTEEKHVHFGFLRIREYGMTMGTNPATSIGAPVCLTWDYTELPDVPINDDEDDDDDDKLPRKHKQKKNKSKSPREFYLNYYRRAEILENAGFSKTEFDKQEKRIRWDRWKRTISLYQSTPILWFKGFKVTRARRKCRRVVQQYNASKTNANANTNEGNKEQHNKGTGLERKARHHQMRL